MIVMSERYRRARRYHVAGRKAPDAAELEGQVYPGVRRHHRLSLP